MVPGPQLPLFGAAWLREIETVSRVCEQLPAVAAVERLDGHEDVADLRPRQTRADEPVDERLHVVARHRGEPHSSELREDVPLEVGPVAPKGGRLVRTTEPRQDFAGLCLLEPEARGALDGYAVRG